MILKKKLDEQMLADLTKQLRHAAPRLSNSPVCDFCGDPNPVVVYASTRMSTGEQRACWRWLACRHCDDAISKAHWFVLRNRVVERLKMMLSDNIPVLLLNRTVERVLLEFHETMVRVPED